jgi:hypothetical protein
LKVVWLENGWVVLRDILIIVSLSFFGLGEA